jgi:carbon-monoxide dehydrogenase iron sulfur subunit
MAKILYVSPDKCTGCRTCELVCSLKNEGVVNPLLARIRIVKDRFEGWHIPMICQQCQDAVCMSVCPTRALSLDEELGIIRRDAEKCINCRMCVAACPFGAMGFNVGTRNVFKCELCDGDPQCVRFCEDDAIRYMEPEMVVMEKKREAAGNAGALFEKYAGRMKVKSV